MQPRRRGGRALTFSARVDVHEVHQLRVVVQAVRRDRDRRLVSVQPHRRVAVTGDVVGRHLRQRRRRELRPPSCWRTTSGEQPRPPPPTRTTSASAYHGRRSFFAARPPASRVSRRGGVGGWSRTGGGGGLRPARGHRPSPDPIARRLGAALGGIGGPLLGPGVPAVAPGLAAAAAAPAGRTGGSGGPAVGRSGGRRAGHWARPDGRLTRVGAGSWTLGVEPTRSADPEGAGSWTLEPDRRSVDRRGSIHVGRRVPRAAGPARGRRTPRRRTRGTSGSGRPDPWPARA